MSNEPVGRVTLPRHSGVPEHCKRANHEAIATCNARIGSEGFSPAPYRAFWSMAL